MIHVRKEKAIMALISSQPWVTPSSLPEEKECSNKRKTKRKPNALTDDAKVAA
jgi:hypothetical protein